MICEEWAVVRTYQVTGSVDICGWVVSEETWEADSGREWIAPEVRAVSVIYCACKILDTADKRVSILKGFSIR